MTGQKEVFVSVDIEASGPTPGIFSMLSLGACLVHDPQQSFYVELQPTSDAFDLTALAVCNLSMEELKRDGTPPPVAIANFAAWLDSITAQGQRAVMVGFNVPFDWSFVNDYFHRFLGRNPLGHDAIDIKAFYMGLSGCAWEKTKKSTLPAEFAPRQDLTHNALDDARVQADIFRRMLETRRQPALNGLEKT